MFHNFKKLLNAERREDGKEDGPVAGKSEAQVRRLGLLDCVACAVENSVRSIEGHRHFIGVEIVCYKTQWAKGLNCKRRIQHPTCPALSNHPERWPWIS